MHIIDRGNYFDVQFNFNEKIVRAIKQIPGRAWDGHRKVWVVPASQKTRLDKFYERWAATSLCMAPMRVGEIPELPDLEREIKLERPMFPFQEKGVAFCLQHQRVIIGDKPGLGKTQQAIATIVAANQFPCVIICPNSLKLNWQQEWRIVAGKRAMIIDDRNKVNWWMYHEKGIVDVFIVNYESVKKYFVHSIVKGPKDSLMVKHVRYRQEAKRFKAAVIDEAHRCKDTSTQTSKFVIGLTIHLEWVMAMTGTPIVNKTEDIVALLFMIGRMREFGGLKFFQERYCKSKTFLPELQYKLKTTCFYQRRKEEVLPDLPAKIRQKMLCDITTRVEYQTALDDLARYLREYQQKTEPEIRRTLRGEIMVRIGICKAISGRGKLAETCEQIDEIITNGQKVIVFVYQKRVVEMLCEQYPHAVTISGADSLTERNQNVKSFQTHPDCNVIICNIKAGGVGINLTAASRIIMVELPWHAADADQCEDRAHRIGQANQLQVSYMIGHRTIDEVIYQIIEDKRALGDAVTGGEDATEELLIDRISDSLFLNVSENGSVESLF